MKKLTRKTFSRKFVAIGLSAFLGIGLVSTGFAAWVMSSNATSETDSNVTVATLSDVSMSFENVIIQDDKSIVFGAEAGDVSGRLISDGVEDACLSIVIKGTIQNAAQLGKLSAKLDLPTSVQNAVNAGYLIAPDSINGVTLYTPAAGETAAYRHDNLSFTLSGENNNTFTFSYTLEFKWGDKFGGMNPSLYYDYSYNGRTLTLENGTEYVYDSAQVGKQVGETALTYPALGKDVSNEVMTNEMQTFREMLSGSANSDQTAKLDYKLTLTATANTSV